MKKYQVDFEIEIYNNIEMETKANIMFLTLNKVSFFLCTKYLRMTPDKGFKILELSEFY